MALLTCIGILVPLYNWPLKLFSWTHFSEKTYETLFGGGMDAKDDRKFFRLCLETLEMLYNV